MHHFGGFGVQSSGAQRSWANFMAHLCQKDLLHPLLILSPMSSFPSIKMSQLEGLKRYKTPFFVLFCFVLAVWIFCWFRALNWLQERSRSQHRKQSPSQEKRKEQIAVPPTPPSEYLATASHLFFSWEKKKKCNSSEIGRILFLLLKSATSEVTTLWCSVQKPPRQLP